MFSILSRRWRLHRPPNVAYLQNAYDFILWSSFAVRVPITIYSYSEWPKRQQQQNCPSTRSNPTKWANKQTKAPSGPRHVWCQRKKRKIAKIELCIRIQSGKEICAFELRGSEFMNVRRNFEKRIKIRERCLCVRAAMQWKPRIVETFAPHANTLLIDVAPPRNICGSS